jgi:hypothetical protein
MDTNLILSILWPTVSTIILVILLWVINKPRPGTKARGKGDN